MSKTTDFIAKITEKLHHDRELRLDISHELQTHLDEAIEEYKASDYNEEDALAAAIKDMGDAEELAEDLWQANRRRMKLRAWCWWIARLTLWPACVLITFTMMVLSVGSVRMLGNPTNMGELDQAARGYDPAALSQRYFRYRLLSQMSPAQQLIAFGDRQAKTQTLRWKPLRDAYPDEPLYQLQYIKTLFPAWGCNPKAKKPQLNLPLIFQELDRGRALDPDNGIYDLFEAIAILPQYTVKEDESRGFELMNYGCGDTSKLKIQHPDVMEEPIDSQLRDRIITCIQRAVTHPYLSTHDFDFMRQRVAQLPEPRTLRDYIFRANDALQVPLNQLSDFRRLARFVCVSAYEQARQEQADQALQWMDMLELWHQREAAGSEVLIELLVARSNLLRDANYRAFIYDAMGDQTRYEKQVATIRADVDWYKRHYTDRRKFDKNAPRYQRAGIILSTLMPALLDYQVDPTPFRMAEYAMVDRGVLTLVNMGLLFLATLLSLHTVWRMWIWGDKHGKPMLIWPGFGALCRVVLIGAVLPVLAFAILANLPVMRREFGLPENMFSLWWYVLLFLCMLILLWYESAVVLRKRAKVLGLAVPDPPSRGWLPGMLVLAGVYIGVEVLFVYLNVRSSGDAKDRELVIVLFSVVMIILCAIGWLMVARQIAWQYGIKPWISKAVWALTLGLGTALVLLLVFAGVIVCFASSQDSSGMIVVTGAICIALGLFLGWAHLAGKYGTCQQYARSVWRLMPVNLMVAGIVLTACVGQSLWMQEAYYTRQIAAQSPIFIDLEIKQSYAKVLQEMWAKGQAAPPSMVPHDAQP